MKNKTNKKGFSIVEILLAMTMFAIFSVGVLYLSIDTVQRDVKTSIDTEALLYAQEGIEAMRNMGDKNFLSLENGDHGLFLGENGWEFIPAPEVIDNFFSRTVIVEDIYRNELGEIDFEAGSTFDADTKKLISEVEWMHKGITPRKITLEALMSNWKGDDWIQTTCDEFTEGTYENTENELLEAPPENNCGITLTLIEESSEFFSSANVGKHATDIEIDGNYAYLSVDSATAGISVVDISNPEVPVKTDDLNIFGKGRALRKDGNKVYVGVQNWLLGVSVVNVSNPNNISLENSWFIGNYGNKPTIKDQYLFMAVNMDNFSLLVYDTELIPFPFLLVDAIDFGDDSYVIEIDGNYAYVGTDDDEFGLRILDISNPYNVQEVAALDVGEEVNAIVISGALAFLGTESGGDSLQVVNISNPSNPSIVTSLNVGGEIEDLTIQGDYLYAAIDDQNAGLAAINISNPYNPTLSYNLDVQGKGTGIEADAEHVYITTNTSNKGLVIVGTTVFGVEEVGTYISQILDTGSNDTRYNFIAWEHMEVPGASLRFQIRTANTPENLETAPWVGSDGTSATYYENSRTLIQTDPSATGKRYCQFKAYLESDGVSTPVVESVTINYTP